MARVHNFSAGPAALPESVLTQIANEMLDYQGCGMSVLEMSHRSSMYQQIIDDAEATLRRLLDIPQNYRVIFLQGGATLQFAGIPMNFMRTGRAGYVVTGNFAKKAWKEAAKYGDAVKLASSEDTDFDRIPALAPVRERASAGDLDYVYICQNNTIFGTMFHELPECGNVPLFADVSSCFLSQPLDISRYGLVYTGAQKNAGAAGVTVIIVRDNLLEDGPAFAQTPQYMDLSLQAQKGSMLNTPNTFGIYVCGKVFHWVEETGGLEAMAQRNWAKANLLYDLLDNSQLFHGTAQKDSRSIANVTFRTDSDKLNAQFVAGAHERGIENIKGHRLVGGMRASVYNAVSMEDVEALVAHARDGAAGAQLARDAVDVVQARQAPAGHDPGAGAGGHARLGGQRERRQQQPRPRLGDAGLASRRGRQPLSVMGSPRRARASHLWAVWRLTPAIAAASAMRMPPPTRSQSSALPLGVSLALGCWDMGGPSSL